MLPRHIGIQTWSLYRNLSWVVLTRSRLTSALSCAITKPRSICIKKTMSNWPYILKMVPSKLSCTNPNNLTQESNAVRAARWLIKAKAKFAAWFENQHITRSQGRSQGRSRVKKGTREGLTFASPQQNTRCRRLLSVDNTVNSAHNNRIYNDILYLAISVSFPSLFIWENGETRILLSLALCWLIHTNRKSQKLI